MLSKKTICLIIPSLERGGMERVVSLISNYCAEEKHNVYIICLLRDNRAYRINDDIVVIAPKQLYRGGVIAKLKIAIKLISDLKQINPAAVIAFSEVFNPLSIVCCKIANVPVYISDRSNPKAKFSFLTEKLRKLTYPIADGIVAQTEISKEIALKKKFNNNITVIANPLKDFSEKSNKEKEKIIVSVGRLIKSKNFSELIDIFLKADSEKEWKLLILGEGPEREFLQQKINSNKATNRIELMGAVENVDDYLSKASIFAFTSTSEGFPNALSEAIGYPLPCIAYDCYAGPSDLIKDNENGFLIPLNNSDIFEKKLKKLMINPSLRHSLTKDYKDHRKKYHCNTISKNYLSFVLSED